MNKGQLIDAIASKTGFSKVQVDTVLKTFIDTVKETVNEGEDISLIGFGIFSRVEYKAKNGVNPATGARIQIAARKSPKFKPSKTFKDLVR